MILDCVDLFSETHFDMRTMLSVLINLVAMPTASVVFLDISICLGDFNRDRARNALEELSAGDFERELIVRMKLVNDLNVV